MTNAQKRMVMIGASGGIGLTLCKTLAANGHRIIGVSRQPSAELERIVDETLACDPVAGDVALMDVLNGEAIDGLAYCPGTITLKPFRGLKVEDFQRDLEINLLGAVRSIQALLPGLRKSDKASIVMFSTVAARAGMNFHTSIAAAKAAVEGFAVSLAAELASHRIRVNVVAPSLTDTPLASRLLDSDAKQQASAKRHPLGRVGRSEDIAAAAAYLLSDSASWITGQIIGVDGGLSTLKPV